MNDLTTTPPSSLPAKPATSQISSGLKSLLMHGDEPSAIREIARNPVMLAECRMVLMVLKQGAAAPAGPDGVRRVIGKRRATLGTSVKTPEESAAWWADYYLVLADLPEAALEAGMAAYLREPTAEFMPKPGKLRALALDTPNLAVRAYQRAQAAIAASVPLPARQRADPEVVKKLMEEFRASVVKPPEAKPPPPIHGAVDEGGLTAEMRAIRGIPEPEE